MTKIRKMVDSNQYQSILTQFSDLMNKPKQPISLSKRGIFKETFNGNTRDSAF